MKTKLEKYKDIFNAVKESRYLLESDEGLVSDARDYVDMHTSEVDELCENKNEFVSDADEAAISKLVSDFEAWENKMEDPDHFAEECGDV